MSEAETPTRPADLDGLPAGDNPLDALWQVLHTPGTRRASHLGEALVTRGLITTGTLQRALELQRRASPHREIGRILVESGAITQAQLDATLASWMGARTIDPRRLNPEPEALRRVPQAIAEREGVLPLMVRDDTLVVAVPDLFDHHLLDELRFVAEMRVVAVGAVPGTLPPAVARAYATLRGPAPAAAPGRATTARELAAELAASGLADPGSDPAAVSESDNTLVRLVNRLIADAIERGASDIHIETAEGRPVVVRMRVDGELAKVLELPPPLRFALVARLKIMADLDISEHRKPQDGKIDFARFGGPHVELRMVTVPTTRGLEDVVLRVLASAGAMPLDKLGLAPANLAALRDVMGRAYGLILICGPTGCGKTTTLHSVMRELNTEKRKIWTAEDPVEITQEGLRQVQVNPRIGWTFAAAMRTFLRADPDVIMIGEMRDAETAHIAVEASLTGHLVMSTLHTNSAPESVTRLLEIGVDPFLFSDSLLAVLAQRLVRRLCTQCRSPVALADDEALDIAGQYVASSHGSGPGPADLLARWRREFGDGQGRLRAWKRVGCPHCEGSGYRGRLGLHELMRNDDALRERIRRRAGAVDLQAAGLAAGMVTLRQDGIRKVLAGDTDLAEVLAATNL